MIKYLVCQEALWLFRGYLAWKDQNYDDDDPDNNFDSDHDFNPSDSSNSSDGNVDNPDGCEDRVTEQNSSPLQPPPDGIQTRGAPINANVPNQVLIGPKGNKPNTPSASSTNVRHFILTASS